MSPAAGPSSLNRLVITIRATQKENGPLMIGNQDDYRDSLGEGSKYNKFVAKVMSHKLWKSIETPS